MRRPLALVVEDEDELREVVSLILSDEGWDVEGARDGLEALERIRVRAPDLILLDMRMPRLDGWELCGALARSGQRRPPVVVMTAGTDVQKSAAEVRADACLPKPFRLEALLELVRRFGPAARSA